MTIRTKSIAVGKTESFGSIYVTFTGYDSPYVYLTVKYSSTTKQLYTKVGNVLIIPGGSLTVTNAAVSTALKTITVSVDDGVGVTQYGYVRLESVPTGADIYIDGSKIGLRTNATYSRVPLGTHTFKMEKAGYKTFEAAANITAANTSSKPFPIGHVFVPNSVTPPVVTPTVLTTKLTISPSVKSLAEGTQMKFTGRLLTTDNKPISGAQILFYKDTTVDTQLKNSGAVIKATTDSNGNYAVFWYADNSNWTSSLVHNIYASYAGAGSKSYKSCKSSNCQVTITPVQNRATKVSFSISPTSTTAGTTVKFTGAVLAAQKIGSTTNYLPAPGATVLFYWVRTGRPDSPITVNGKALSVTTSNTGSFSASWVAVDLDGNPDTDTYSIKAVVQKTPLYASSSTTTNPKITISAGTGSLNCTSTPAGATVYIDGKLQSQKTPRTFTGLAVGTHTVEFRLAGYTTVSKQAVISKQGVTTTVSATLVATVKTTTLTLNSPGSSFFVGDRITFGGTLKDSAGAVVPGVTIELMKQNGSGITDAIPDVSLKNGSTTVKATTDKFGNFSVYWTAVDMNLTPGVTSHKIYARFTGTTAYTKSNSRVYDIAIKPKEALATVLNILVSPTAAKVGGIIAISGTLKTIEGTPVPAATITFHDDQYIIDSELKNGSTVLKATTTTSGTFSVNWTAALLESLTSSDTVKIYAKYTGHILYKASQSATKEVAVTKTIITPTVSLSASPSTVEAGKTVTLSGYLMDPSTNKGISGAKVTVYDKDDILNLTNDTIGTATTNSTGYYTLTWIASPELKLTATQSIVELFAQYDQTSEYAKATSTIKEVTIKWAQSYAFDSEPTGATIELDGKLINAVGNSTKHTTSLYAYVSEGTHTAKFYFTTATMPAGKTYSPLTIQFTISNNQILINGEKKNSINAVWDSGTTLCSLLGIDYVGSGQECSSALILKIANFAYDLSAFTRIMYGYNIYGIKETPSKTDYFSVLCPVFPFDEAWTAVKALKGLRVNTMGSLIAHTIAKEPKLVSILDSSLFFNRALSMSTAERKTVMGMFEDILAKNGKATDDELYALRKYIESFVAKDIPSSTLATAQSELAKVFTDPQIKNSIDFLKRFVPDSAIGKEFTEVFGKFLEGSTVDAVPTPAQLLKLAKAGETNPAEITEFIASFRFTQLRYAQHKLEFLGGPSTEAAKMLDEWINTVASDAISDKTGVIQKICTKYSTKISQAAANVVPADVQRGIMALTGTHENAIYGISKAAGDEYVAAMKSIFAKYSEANYGKATGEVIDKSIEITQKTLINNPTKSAATIDAVDDALTSTERAIALHRSLMGGEKKLAQTSAGRKAIQQIKNMDSSVSPEGVKHIERVYTKIGRDMGPTVSKQSLDIIDPTVKSIADELPTVGTNKGTKITSYSGLNAESNLKKLADNVESKVGSSSSSGIVKEIADDVLQDMNGVVKTLKSSGISVLDDSMTGMSSTTKYVVGTTEDIVSGGTETAAERVYREAMELVKAGTAQKKIELEVANIEYRIGFGSGGIKSETVDVLHTIIYDIPSTMLSNGKKLSDYPGYSTIELLGKFKKYLDDHAISYTNINLNTIKNFEDEIGYTLAKNLDELAADGVYILKGSADDLTDMTKKILELTPSKISANYAKELAAKAGMSAAEKAAKEAAEKAAKEAAEAEAKALKEAAEKAAAEEAAKKEAADKAAAADKSVPGLKSQISNTLRSFSDAQHDLAYNYLKHFETVLDEIQDITTSKGTKLGNYIGLNDKHILEQLLDDIYALGSGEKTGAAVKKLVNEALQAMFTAAGKLADNGVHVTDIPSGSDEFTKWIAEATGAAGKEIVEKAPDVITDIVLRYQTLFKNIIDKSTIIKITPATLTDFMDHIAKNPKDAYAILKSIDVDELIDALYKYEYDGKTLAEFIRILRNAKKMELQIGAETNFDAFITSTTKAALKLYKSGEDPGLMRLWDTIFDMSGQVKKIDAIMNTKYYRDLYNQVNKLSSLNPKVWGTTMVDWVKSVGAYWIHQAKLHPTMTFWLLATEWIFPLYAFQTMFGVAPGNRSKQVSAYISALTAHSIRANKLCKDGLFDALTTEVNNYEKSKDDLDTYYNENTDAIIREGYGDLATNAVDTATEEIKTHRDSIAAKQCGAGSTSGGTSGGTSTGSYDSIWVEVNRQSDTIESLYFGGKEFHDAGNTAEVKRISADHKTQYDALMGYIAQNMQAIKDNNHETGVQSITKLHYNHQVLLTAWSKEGDVTGPLEPAIVDQMVEDIKWKIITQYGTCDDLLDSGSSELARNIDTLEDLIAEAEDMLEEYASQISELGRTDELQDTIDIAKGRLDVYAAGGITGPGNTSLYNTITTLLKDLDSSRWGCNTFFGEANNTALAGLLPTYADQITRLQTIRTDNATEVETLGLTKELEENYNYYNSYYVYYSGQAVTGTPTTELPTDSALYEQIDSKIYDLNTFYWNCYKAKKRGDTTTFNSNFTIFKRMLQELKDMQSSKAAEITDIGYTNTVADAIADYSTKVIELSSSSSSSGSTDNPSTPTTPTTPDDSDTSGGDYTNETYNKASALIDKIDTNSNTCWTHCKAGAKSALTAALKTYVSNHNALKKLYTEHLPELKSAKADTWVKNDIDYHTSDLAKLQNCASTSSGTEDPVDEPDTTDMTDTEVIDTVDQYLEDMDDLWEEGQNATTANTTEVA